MLSFWHYDLRRSSASCGCVSSTLFAMLCYLFFLFPWTCQRFRCCIPFACKAERISPFGVKIMLFVVCCWLFIPSPPFIFFVLYSAVVGYAAAKKKSRRAPAGHHQHKIECNFPSSSSLVHFHIISFRDGAPCASTHQRFTCSSPFWGSFSV